jgi:hypothetical protein
VLGLIYVAVTLFAPAGLLGLARRRPRKVLADDGAHGRGLTHLFGGLRALDDVSVRRRRHGA